MHTAREEAHFRGLGCAHFHNAENVVEPLWRALCSGILMLPQSFGAKGAFASRLGSRSRAQVAGRFALKGDLRQGELAFL
jgi:hypothetical protein